MSDGFLHKYFLNNSGARLHKWVHYFDVYERYLERFRNKSPVMFEIGIGGGGSLPMWKEYFGPGATIIGLDINPNCVAHKADGIDIFIGSQDDPKVIDAIFEKYPHIDVLLDDGSHIMNHMVKTFEMAYDRISPNGVYMVEDAHTSYWPEFEGGLGVEGAFMEFAKAKVDELNAVHTRNALPVSHFTKNTDAIAFYDSIVVFEKRPQGARQAPATHRM